MKFELPLALLFCSIGPFDAFAPKAFAPKAFSSKHSSSRLFASADNENVVIIGGGVIGLSIAHYLATNSGKSITLLDRGVMPNQVNAETETASFAAAGALGQQFFGDEGTPYSPLFDENEKLKSLLDMCVKSGEMYGDWLSDFLDDPDEVGYRSNHTSIFPRTVKKEYTQSAEILPEPIMLNKEFKKNKFNAQKIQPKLAGSVNMWSFIEGTASVDTKRLMLVLRESCRKVDVTMKFDTDATLLKTDDDDKCVGVKFKDEDGNDREIKGTVVVATGAVLGQLMGEFGTIPLNTTGSEGYTVELATSSRIKKRFVEEAAFSEEVGVLSQSDGRVRISNCLGHDAADIKNDAEKIIPDLKEETIVKKRITATRPMTNDYLPILGTDDTWGDLYVAGGFNTYGLWLAPKASQLIGDWILGEYEDFDDDEKKFLDYCYPNRSFPSDPVSGFKRKRVLCL